MWIIYRKGTGLLSLRATEIENSRTMYTPEALQIETERFLTSKFGNSVTLVGILFIDPEMFI